MMDKTFELFNKTMNSFEKTMDMFGKEVEKIFKSSDKKKSSKTKIKIKVGSKIPINGVLVELLTDVIVLTDDPEKLMKID